MDSREISYMKKMSSTRLGRIILWWEQYGAEVRRWADGGSETCQATVELYYRTWRYGSSANLAATEAALVAYNGVSPSEYAEGR
jgi:hypothetical protein